MNHARCGMPGAHAVCWDVVRMPDSTVFEYVLAIVATPKDQASSWPYLSGVPLAALVYLIHPYRRGDRDV